MTEILFEITDNLVIEVRTVDRARGSGVILFIEPGDRKGGLAGGVSSWSCSVSPLVSYSHSQSLLVRSHVTSRLSMRLRDERERD